jgi:hypothetical protein
VRGMTGFSAIGVYVFPSQAAPCEKSTFPKTNSGDNVWMNGHVHPGLNCCVSGNNLYLSQNPAMSMIP